ncbi:N-acetylglucosamine-6-phosphate deacetylase [Neoasaia chiangmaiensis NBRC 101099]|uniref:N-acetylglucosamine-6-phosphate deacetylase n=1 Tax=Neoasaia chiangmaiensis TaxID=320497 RepID=A0A1U9KSS6_9PROT|nr:N-acetylglucosamine-6-phosphate deacetylase [Neoasaia chiangmaiensis]AQS88835.1 N-acetylglucosamine-6-phosphate deacetylase [Neoasaia chiangmaiensis]GBR40634.1 N-acetylglucosamine-6-phosphate deacetylase [Neoasaia chiangmaiensis NBRC 101099]GEN13807.1 N-acetylglucosamine-6-phosphate deacetylase [Neoasaia chiangmaiensis]
MRLEGHIVLPDRILPGRVSFDTHIRSVEPDADAPRRYILPGFIDGHVHGGDGADTMDGAAAIDRLSRFHLSHGTTTILPTTITRPWADVMDALHAISEVMSRGVANGPRIHGAHLEGPFVSPHKLGAQPPFAIPPSPERVAEAVGTGCVRVVTLAPELEHAETAIAAFAEAGVRISLGHTTTDYEGADRAICAICAAGGVPGGTHLFNAMSPIEGRRPGPVTALMCHDEAFGEMIFDTHHVHPASFRLVSRVMGNRLLFVTDAMRGAGQPEGPSQLGGQDVMIEDGVVRLPGGSLAGSVLTLDRALRNAVESGASLPNAARLVSSNAAAYLGLSDRGSITAGKLADFVVMDERLEIAEVWVGGARQA